MAVDEAAFCIIGKEGDGAGDVIWRCEAGHGDAVGDVGVGVGAGGLVDGVHFRFDPSGADGVDADAATSPLGGEGAGEADEAVLGGVVGCAVGDAEEAGDGGYVDDGAAAGLEHGLAEGFREQEWLDEIDFEDTAVVGCGNLFGGADVADAGVVDEGVYAAPGG